MSRRDDRLNIVFTVYQSLLLNKDIRVLFSLNFEDRNVDDFCNLIIEDIILNKNKYIDEISNYLVNWTFDRLSFLEQAILLVGTSELKQNLNSKNIVIDEAVNIAKKYCDDQSYKFINGVLDRI